MNDSPSDEPRKTHDPAPEPRQETVNEQVARIAHDLNNMLGGVLGFASLLESKIKRDHAELTRYTRDIVASAQACALLCTQLQACVGSEETGSAGGQTGTGQRETGAVSAQPKAATVMVVDDSEGMRETLRDMLKELGFRSLCCAGGEEALAVANKQGGDIAVCLLDIEMPGLDGYQTLRQLRAVAAHIKIVVCTGHGDERLDAMLKEWAAGYLLKPFDLDDLDLCLRRVMNGHGAAGSAAGATSTTEPPQRPRRR